MKINSMILVLLTLAACSPHRTDDASVAAQGPSLDESELIEIARNAVTENDTWADRAEVGDPKRNPDGTWSVMVWRIPEEYGGHRLVVIDDAGQVTDYIGGY